MNRRVRQERQGRSWRLVRESSVVPHSPHSFLTNAVHTALRVEPSITISHLASIPGMSAQYQRLTVAPTFPSQP